MTIRRGRGSNPKDDHTNLSEDDLERRLAGGAGLGGPVPERAPRPIDTGIEIGVGETAATTTTSDGGPTSGVGAAAAAAGGSGRGASHGRGGRRDPGGRGRGGSRRGLVWRDAALVLVLLALLAAGARFVLPSEPATALASPSTAASQVALASPTVTVTMATTPTLEPTPATSPSEGLPSLGPSPQASATLPPAPTPTPTPAPGQTPKPTPKPTPTPGTLVVVVNVKNDSIADASKAIASSAFSVQVAGASPSPATFSGSSSGTSVKVAAGASYAVTIASGPTGFTQTASIACSGAVPTGATATCTFTEDDIPAGIEVFTDVPASDPGITASDVQIDVTASSAIPPQFDGTTAGHSVSFDAYGSYAVTAVPPSGYHVSSSSSGCSNPNGLGRAEFATCTITVEADSGFAPGSGVGWAWLIVPLRRPRRRRDR